MEKSAKSWSKERQEPRFPVRRASVQVRQVAGEVRNLSQRGMAIVTPVSLPVGGRLRFRVVYAGEEIGLDGVVRWSYLRRTARNDFGEVIPVFHAGVALADLRDWPRPLLLSGLGEAGDAVALPERRLETGPQLLEIRRPADGAVVTRSPVVVRGVVSPAFDGFTIAVNGAIAEVEAGRFEARVPLVAGPNILTARVLAERQSFFHSRITVTLSPPRAARRPTVRSSR